MKVGLTIKVAMLAGLAAITFFVTSSVVARIQPRRSKRTNTAIANEAAGSSYQMTGRMGAGIQEMPPGIDTSYASGTMHRLGVEVEGQVVHVVALASIRDTRPGMNYVWSVRLLKPTTQKVMFEKRYVDQIFGMPPEQQRKINFEDMLEMPVERGTYTLELVAFQVPPDEGMAGLDDPKIAFNRRGPRGTAVVNIGGN